MKTRVRVWTDVDNVIKASDINKRSKYRVVMEEVPKGEKSN